MKSLVIVGFGGMGRHHYKRLKGNKFFKVTGVFDINCDVLNYAKSLGLNVYENYNEVLSDKNVDCILIATPNDCHYEQVIMAAKSKKHIICEKPVTLSSQLLLNMIKETELSGVVFIVNQNRREDKDFLIIKNIIESDRLGRVYKIESNVMSSHGIPGDWRKAKEKGGGMILDWGVHLIDQAISMFSNKVTSVYCKNSYIFGHEVDDGCDIRIIFDNSLEYKIIIDTNSFRPLPRWVIYGENGTAVIKNWQRQGCIVAVKMRIDKKNNGKSLGNGYSKTMAKRSFFSIKRNRLPFVKNNRDFIYNSFNNSIDKGVTPIVTSLELMRVMKIMEAAMLSDKNNEVVHTSI